MIYLIVKMLALLLIAGGIGAAVGWFLRGAQDREANEARAKNDAGRIAALRAARDEAEARLAAAAVENSPSAPPSAPAVEEPAAEPATGFVAMERPDDGGDDLRKIVGIGPKIEGLLHEMGIWRYRQIANLSAAEVERVDDELQFKGRIARDDWQGQARALVDGKSE